VKEIINPFSFLTDEQSAIEIKKIEKEKEEIRRRHGNERKGDLVIPSTAPRNRKPIKQSNPFLNMCKKTFEFVRDNLDINVDIGGSVINPVGVIQDPLDKLKPRIKTQISAGPINIEVDSDTVMKNLKRGGVITH
jgi:hypothetical protein